jgi:hypothetical protein
MGIVFTSYVDGVSQSVSDVFVSSNVSIAQVTPVAAPEMDSASAASALTLLLGGLAVLSGRRKISADLAARRQNQRPPVLAAPPALRFVQNLNSIKKSERASASDRSLAGSPAW